MSLKWEIVRYSLALLYSFNEDINCTKKRKEADNCDSI